MKGDLPALDDSIQAIFVTNDGPRPNRAARRRKGRLPPGVALFTARVTPAELERMKQALKQVAAEQEA